MGNLKDKYLTHDYGDEFEAEINEVLSWLDHESEENRNQFLLTGYNNHKLIEYHHTLGRKIRNHFRLWEREYEPEIVTIPEGMDIDVSPYHPDQLSQYIIEQVWKRGRAKAKI